MGTATSEAGALGICGSIGIALAPEDDTDFDSLYKNAHAALYRARKRGKDGLVFYAPARRGRARLPQPFFSPARAPGLDPVAWIWDRKEVIGFF